MDNCGTKTQYQYDALGRRTKKTNTEQKTEFLWDGDVLLSETQNEDQPKICVFEPYSFKLLAQIQNSNIYHYHLDHLGTPQELTNNRGDIVWSARYITYGNLALKEVEDVEDNLRFQGQYFDQETGLHYNRHRYYNPNTGQFTQQDPIGLLGGLNNYQYAPNPVSWIDPFGLKAKDEDCPRPKIDQNGNRIKRVRLGDVKFKSIWNGEGLKFFVKDDNGDVLDMGLAEIVNSEKSIIFGIYNNENTGVIIKPEGFSLTEAVISITIKHFMDMNGGELPVSLPGLLGDANKINYQKEYVKAIDLGLSEKEAKEMAIKNISFGKYRANMGYDDFEIKNVGSATITHNSKGELLDIPLENVPKGVEVENAKLTNKGKLDQTLRKYDELYEKGKNDNE